MQKNIYTCLALLSALFFLTPISAQYNSLRVQDPRSGRSGISSVDSAWMVIRPKGLFAEVSYYLVYSAKV
jgi:hypothetical protein